MNAKIQKLRKEYETLLDKAEKKKWELCQESDGYVYVTNTRCYGSCYYEEHKNFVTVQHLCQEYYGDNGIVDVWTNNPFYEEKSLNAFYAERKANDYDMYDDEGNCNYPDVITTYGTITYLTEEQLKELDTKDVSMGQAVSNWMSSMIPSVEE